MPGFGSIGETAIGELPDENSALGSSTEAPRKHDLVASDLTTGAPTLGNPALSQVHALTADGIAIGGEKVSVYANLQADDASLTARVTVTKLKMADRLNEIADELSLLRLNSLAQAIADLREISKNLRTDPSDQLQQLTAKALRALGNLFDSIGSERGCRVLIAGAVGGILATGGWTTVTAFAVVSAVWFGKDAYMEAIDKLFPKSKD